MRILIVEDEPDIQGFLKYALGQEGYYVDVAGDAASAKELAINISYDILLVDLGLPDQDGIDLILWLRKHGLSVPVMILSARRSLDDRVRGLTQGGDDYLTKPFALSELSARLRNLLKRRNTNGHAEAVLRVRDLELDFIRHEVSKSGKRVPVTSQEFVMLEFLCRNADQVVTRSMIIERVWGMRFEPRTNMLEVHLSRLRGKLDDANTFPLIETVRGKGYIVRSA